MNLPSLINSGRRRRSRSSAAVSSRGLLLLLVLPVGVLGQVHVLPPPLPLFLPLLGHFGPMLDDFDDVVVDVVQLALGPNRRLDVLGHFGLKFRSITLFDRLPDSNSNRNGIHLNASLDKVRGPAVGRRGDPADSPHAVQVVGHVHGEVVIDDVHRVARVDSAGCLGFNLTLGCYQLLIQ